MAQKYFPMLSIDGDRAYSDQDFAEYYKMIFRDGIAMSAGNALKIKESTSGGMRVVLSSGMAIMRGYQYINTDDLAVVIPVASTTQDRTDSVVIRHDVNAREIYVAVKRGNIEVERTDLVWELQLATIEVPKNSVNIPAEYITDKRANQAVCGYSTPFENVNVSGLEDQYNSMLERVFNEFETKSSNDLETLKSTYQNWFQGLQDQLDTNQAGNLQNQINELKPETELIVLDHNLNKYPAIECLYWEYGIGTVPLENQPAEISWDGTAPVTVPIKIEHLSRQQVKIYVPVSKQLIDPVITESGNIKLLVSGHKSISLEVK